MFLKSIAPEIKYSTAYDNTFTIMNVCYKPYLSRIPCKQLEAVHVDTCSLLVGRKMLCCGTYLVNQNVHVLTHQAGRFCHRASYHRAIFDQ